MPVNPAIGPVTPRCCARNAAQRGVGDLIGLRERAAARDTDDSG